MIENAISTTSDIVQDNSSIEYVSPETNPIATTTHSEQLFDFNAVHNGESCIASLDPKDRGTERQFRFTRALLCTLLGVKSENTITNHVQALINRGVVNDVKNLTSLNIKNENGNGAVKITLYDLKVFNYLVMRLDTDQAWEKKAKFNDVLVERETGITQAQTQPTIFDYARALIAEKERSDALEAQNKALESELSYEKEAHEKDNEDFKAGFDIVNAQKAQIGSRREAKAMATASSAKAHQRFAEKVLETHASELIMLRAVAEERRSQLWDADRTAQEIYRLRVLKKEYSMSTLQNKARRLLSRFAEKLGKRPELLPNGSTYPDSFGRLQPSMSTYYERDVKEAVLDWVVENTDKFALIGGKRDPLNDEW